MQELISLKDFKALLEKRGKDNPTYYKRQGIKGKSSRTFYKFEYGSDVYSGKFIDAIVADYYDGIMYDEGNTFYYDSITEWYEDIRSDYNSKTTHIYVFDSVEEFERDVVVHSL